MVVRARSDVVVAGGGVVGLAIAWQTAQAGARVTVADPSPGRGASWAAAGMLAPVGEAAFGEHALTALNVAAARVWPTFARALEDASGRPVHYRAQGSLLVAVDASDAVAAEDLVAYHRQRGLAVKPLSASECRRAEPLLFPGVRAGADLPDDHQVDNRRVVEALIVACRRAGITFVEDRVASVDAGHGRVAAVGLCSGSSLPCASLVVAAGCRSAELAGIPGPLLPPVRPVKGLTIRLRAPSAVPHLRRPLRGLVHGRSCYLVPRVDGTVVLGATVEEKGFDLSVQAGPLGDLLDDARRLVPSLEEYEVVDTTTGLRPGSPDNGPIVGATEVDGLVFATGHYRNGILLAPATAQEVVRILRGQGCGPPHGPAAEPPAPPTAEWAAFRPDRFVALSRTRPAVGHPVGIDGSTATGP